MPQLILGILAYKGIYRAWYYAKYTRVLPLPILMYGFIPAGIGWTLLGIGFLLSNLITKRVVDIILLAGLGFLGIGIFFYLVHPKWIKPKWVREEEAKFGPRY